MLMQFPSDAARLSDLDDLAWLSSSDEHSELAACCIQLSERKQSLKLVVCNEMVWTNVALWIRVTVVG